MAGYYDVVIAGGGPAGLAAAQAAASAGASVLVIEREWEIGSPTRTSGGSFFAEMLQLGIPRRFLHPIHTVRFVAPAASACFPYAEPVLCVIDVRGTYQHLASEAAAAGASIQVAHTVVSPLLQGTRVAGVRVRDHRGRESDIASRVVIDATGYRSVLLKAASVYAGAQRFGVGAEYDLYAPQFDQTEAVLVVGSQIAPCGYAWAFPWGGGRVRAGVGVIRRDSDANPADLLPQFIARGRDFGLNFEGAQPLEYHHGLIPSDGLPAGSYTGDGILAAGDSAGHPSALVGEGIRWAIEAGRLSGATAAECVKSGDTSRAALIRFEVEWEKRHGRNLRIAAEINRRIAGWTDDQWNRRTELLQLLTPEQFARALRSDFSGGWLLRLLLSNPKLVRTGAKALLERFGATV